MKAANCLSEASFCSRRNQMLREESRRPSFSLVRFFVPHKEMNTFAFSYTAKTNDKRTATDGLFSTAC
jgi:hypothetical protein